MMLFKQLLLVYNFVISCGNTVCADSCVSTLIFLILRFHYSVLVSTLLFLFPVFDNEVVNIFIYNSFYFGFQF
jgi:hypothetical protein